MTAEFAVTERIQAPAASDTITTNDPYCVDPVDDSHFAVRSDAMAALGGGVLVSDVMTAFPAYIRLGATIRRAAEVVSVSEVGQLMVLDYDDRFVGSLSEEDLVPAMLPGFDDVTAAGGTLADAFHVFLERGRALADRVIDPLVERDAATVRPTAPIAPPW